MKSRLISAAFVILATIFSGCQQKDIGPAKISVKPEDKIEFSAKAEVKTVTVTSNYCWEAEYDSEWFKVTPESGDAAPEGVTVTISALANEGYDRSDAIIFFANHSKLVNAAIDIVQAGEKGKGGDVEAISVADFIKKADNSKYYQLSGKVSGFSSQYCSFDLTDESGSIYVYSVDNKDEWLSKIKNGGTVTLKGKYEYYEKKSQHEVVNAVILSFTDGGDQPSEDIIFQESFASSQGAFTINDVKIPAEATYVWSFAQNYGMKASAYINNVNYEAESWLISPEINLADQTKAYLSFSHAVNFCAAPASTLKVFITKDNGANWTELKVNGYPDGKSWTFVSSGDVDLAAYLGQKVKIGFKYVSTTSESPTWEIKDFKISKVEGSSTTKEPEFVAGTKVELTMNSSLPWATAEDPTYKAGLSMTSNGVKVSFFQNTSTTNTDNCRQSDHVRIYKSYALRISLSDSKPIKQIVFYCNDPTSGSYYANDITVGSTVVKRFSDNIVNWVAPDATTTEFLATLTGGQLRVRKLVIVY